MQLVSDTLLNLLMFRISLWALPWQSAPMAQVYCVEVLQLSSAQPACSALRHIGTQV